MSRGLENGFLANIYYAKLTLFKYPISATFQPEIIYYINGTSIYHVLHTYLGRMIFNQTFSSCVQIIRSQEQQGQ